MKSGMMNREFWITLVPGVVAGITIGVVWEFQSGYFRKKALWQRYYAAHQED